MKKIVALCLMFSVLFSLGALPDGFSSARLGMELDELKDALKNDHQFGYRGDRDVSLSPSDGQALIETDTLRTAPYSFLERCWFQFADGKLYIITLNLNSSKIDYYSIFSALCEKYGNPDEISPQKSVWKDDSVIFSLEKPLTLKYIDAQTFDSKRNSSNVMKAASETAREQFLDSL